MQEEEYKSIKLTKEFKPSMFPYSQIDKCNLTRKLRQYTTGYNNNNDFSQKRIMTQRRDGYNEYKENKFQDDEITKDQLKLLDPMYRVVFTREKRVVKIKTDIQKTLEKIGINLPKKFINKTDNKDSQYYILSTLFQLFEESIKKDDVENEFKDKIQDEFSNRFDLQENSNALQNLIRLLYEIQEKKTFIMNIEILDENDPTLESSRFEFGTTGHAAILMSKYEDSYKYNQQYNVLDYQFFDDEEIQNDDDIRQIIQGDKNYVREFYDLYGNILIQKSPEFWQFLLYDALRAVCNKNLTIHDLELKLLQMFDEQEEIVKYLVNFRKDLIKCLHKQNFGKKDPKLEAKQEAAMIYKETSGSTTMNNYQVLNVLQMDERQINESIKENLKGQKIKPTMEYNSETKEFEKNSKDRQYKMDEQFSAADFIKMDENQLVKKIPTLQKLDNPDYLMFRIDPIQRLKPEESEIIAINTLPKYAQIAFEGVTNLNLIQSKSYQTSFLTDENMLLSAPTGAGKTNVALLAILREISKHLGPDNTLIDGDFKIVYLSPMKALAAEITEKFQERLKKLGVQVKECTGDMQLTKTELEETQVIITTPEKWDVITRKTNQVADQLQLLLIDEIHLLNDERGPVLECLVARTLQNIERQQRTMRLFGISATMPNYLDVAAFLNVKKQHVYFFDHRYRPIPLLQKFVGVKEPSGARKAQKSKKDILNDLAYEFANGVVKHGKQVLIFVHSRKETTTTAQFFLEKAKKDGTDRFLRQSVKNKNLPRIQDKMLQKQIPDGCGFHHAGMLRKDRNIVEKLFQEGTIRVLCATSTLAWGVNLPAYSVIIKGTDVYDPGRGGAQLLSVLDVQQMFGRAGRPQYDQNGEAILLTDHNKVGHYMGQMNYANNLESKLSVMLKEALNAEIVLGNVTSQKEAFDWINHSFFAIRIRRNPLQYDCRVLDKINRDLRVEIHISEMIEDCLKELDKQRLIRFDRKSGYLSSTELGRITSHYYIKCESMKIFCEAFGITVQEGDDNAEDFIERRNEYKSDLDILKILAKATEFSSIKDRPEEHQELESIIDNYWTLEEQLDLKVAEQKSSGQKNIMQERIIETEDKIIILIIGYLSRIQRYENFSLVSDTQFVIQNASRIFRCLLEMVMMKNMAFNTEILIRWCKLLENRIMPGESPMRQFCRENFQGFNAFKNRKENNDGFLAKDLVNRIENKNIYIDELKDMQANELSYALDTKTVVAATVKKFVRYLPEIEVDYKIKPVAQTVLQMDVTVKPLWTFTGRWHSKNEVFWIIVDNEEEILYKDSFAISQKQQYNHEESTLNFFLPYRDSNAAYYRLTITSNSWICDPDYQIQLDLGEIYIKGEKMDFTELLDLQPLPITVFKNPQFSSVYPKIKYLNPNQTQVFHALYHTNENCLIGSPTGSGKTMMCEFSVYRVFQEYPGTKVVYVAPMKAIAKERLLDWDRKFRPLGKDVLELTGDFTPDLDSLMKADVLITTPEKWDGISRNWNNRGYVKQISLLIFDEIHLLGQDRGPVLEVIVSRMNLIASKTGKKCRMIGLSTAMANGTDVAEWFGVPKFFFFNFRPHIRPVPITIYFDGFSEKNYCPRMQTMNKPAFNAIKKFSDEKPTIIFVSSRRQTRLTALDLIAYTMHETGGESSRYVKCPQDELDIYISQVQDEYLVQTLTFGIGMHHAGLIPNDRRIVEELFVSQKIQVLVATSTLAWGVNLPARLVIVKGTEYFDPKTKRYVDMPVTDILQMIGRAGRPQFDDKGIACVFVEQSKKNFYRQYLNDPFPIESSLISQLHDHFNAEISNGTITNKQQCMDWITWTYFFRRLLKNPSYYGLDNAEPKTIKKYLIELVDNSLNRLKEHKTIEIDEEDGFKLQPTFLGNLGAFYYIKHESMSYFEEKLTQDISLPDILRTLAYAQEYAEVPLRHNEENLNEELAKICPLKVNKRAMDNPHEKTYLLFQAHLFRLPLPIRDYLTDSKTVIDSSIRIIHCLIDMAAEKQYLQTTLNLMLVMQMLVQGVWFDQSCLVNIPYLEGQNLQKLGYLYLCELIELNAKGKLEKALQKVPELAKNVKKVKEVVDAVNTIPSVRMKHRVYKFNDDDEEESVQTKTSNQEVLLDEGGEAKIGVELFRENFNYPLRIQVQATSKIKDASWWLVIGNEHEDKVLGLKKLYFKKNVSKKIQVQLPDNFELSPNLRIFLISDSYLGIDQMAQINLKATEQSIHRRKRKQQQQQNKKQQ